MANKSYQFSKAVVRFATVTAVYTIVTVNVQVPTSKRSSGRRRTRPNLRRLFELDGSIIASFAMADKQKTLPVSAAAAADCAVDAACINLCTRLRATSNIITNSF